ncbi:hypothetical protein Taro_051066, partial [Colocasia esculenta]|nr:hypothetical protein [Colocasia esculenta]
VLPAKRCKGEEGGDERYTLDGSVDRHGDPAIRGKTGGWSVGLLLLVNQGLTNLAFFGVGVNLVLFMARILRQDNAAAANNVSQWTGTAYIFSLLGAFLSDSYWGRYKASVVFQLINLDYLRQGLVMLALSSYLLLLKPCVPGEGNARCEPPTSLEVGVFYISIYQIALGNGAFQPSITTFGADQFDGQDPHEGRSKVAFFSYFYMATNLGTVFSGTVLVYLEDKGEWVLGFWISAGAATVALALFLAGAPWYRHFSPGGNPLTRVCQVLVAAVKKWGVEVPTHGEGEGLFETDGKESPVAINGRRRLPHTPGFRFLDRAAVMTPEEEASEGAALEDQHRPLNPWRLCTVTQVEEVKCILRLLPIWLCTIVYSIIDTQMASIFIEQGAAMSTAVGSFHIPPASMTIFEILGVTVTVLLYQLCFLPFLRELSRWEPTELQRMGAGLLLSAVGMVVSGLVEFQRLRHARRRGGGAASTLSILWQVPQYLIMGASEVFMYVGQLEFFNGEAPDGLKSFGSALYMSSMSLGNYASSLLVTAVMGATGRGDRLGWIPEDLNRGHLDWFYYLLAAMAAADMAAFVGCCRWYRGTLSAR